MQCPIGVLLWHASSYFLPILLLDCFFFFFLSSSFFLYSVNRSNQKRTSSDSLLYLYTGVSASTLLNMNNCYSYVGQFCPCFSTSLPYFITYLLFPGPLPVISPSKIKNKSTFSLTYFLCQLPHNPFILLCGTTFKSVACTCFLQFFFSYSNF